MRDGATLLVRSDGWTVVGEGICGGFLFLLFLLALGGCSGEACGAAGWFDAERV